MSTAGCISQHLSKREYLKSSTVILKWTELMVGVNATLGQFIDKLTQ